MGEDDDYPLRGVGEVAGRLDARAGRAAPGRRVLRLAHRGPRGDRPLRHPAPRVIKAVISDFGGVITNPLLEGFTRAHADLGVPVEALGTAMRLAAERHAEPPLWTLERGQITEARVPRRARGDPHRGHRQARRTGRLRPAPDGGAGAQHAAAGLLPPSARRARPPARGAVQQRAGVAADLARALRDRRAVRARRGLRLRGHPQAGTGDLRPHARAAWTSPARTAPSSTTSRSTSPPPARRACTPSTSATPPRRPRSSNG